MRKEVRGKEKNKADKWIGNKEEQKRNMKGKRREMDDSRMGSKEKEACNRG